MVFGLYHSISYCISKPFLLLSALDEREALDLLPKDADENDAEGRLIVAVVVTEVIVGFLFPALGPPGLLLHFDLRHFKGNSGTRFCAHRFLYR